MPGCEAKFCFVRVVGGQRCNIHIFLLLTLICAKNEQIISKIWDHHISDVALSINNSKYM